MLTWNRIQSLYEPLVDRHARAAQLAGLSCPSTVFTALFHDRHDGADLEWLLRGIDFSEVTWEQEDRSGVALRQVSVDRAFQEAIDESSRPGATPEPGSNPRFCCPGRPSERESVTTCSSVPRVSGAYSRFLTKGS